MEKRQEVRRLEEEKSIEFEMPYGTGLSELEAALDELESDTDYRLSSSGKVLSSRTKGTGEDLEEAENWAEKADAYTAFAVTRLAGGFARPLQSSEYLFRSIISNDRSRYTLGTGNGDNPHIVNYEENGDRRSVRIEKHKLPGVKRYLEPDPEVAERLQKELHELAP